MNLAGNGYQRVGYAGIGTMEELQTYLRGLFAEDIVDELLWDETNPPLYRNLKRGVRCV